MRGRRHFGLLGHNIGYSRSPEIFSILSEIRDTAVDFECLDVPAHDLETAISTLKNSDGFSVTIPYKEAIVPYMDSLSEDAGRVGAVNAVRVESGRMRGHNTDMEGFIAPLEQAGFAGRTALVLGGGGAARAVTYSLTGRDPAFEILLCGRDSGRATTLAARLAEALAAGNRIRAVTYDQIQPESRFDLIVNCTPVGGAALPERSPLPDSFVFSGRPVCYDLIYEPEETVFLRRAAGAGCVTIGGLSMLVRQAVESYILWTGDECDRDSTVTAILARLKGHGGRTGL